MPPIVEALLSPCVRPDGERLDASLSPAPSQLAEDGRGVLYALGADGIIRAAPARHCRRVDRGDDAEDDHDDDGHDGVLDPSPTPHEFRPTPALEFEPRTIAVSPSGHFAAVGGLRHDATSRPSSPPSSALAIVSLRDSGVDPSDDPSAHPGCAATQLLEDAFRRHASVRVLRAAWHPNSDGHLVVLLSDGTLHVFDAAASMSGAPAEQSFRLDPWGRGAAPGPYPLRPEIVDIAFAPPHGWGALALILLGREGDVYTMCPFAPWGARYPRVTLESLVPPDAHAELWLSRTFPQLRFPAADGHGTVGGGGMVARRRRVGRHVEAAANDDDGDSDYDEYDDDDDDDDGRGLFGTASRSEDSGGLDAWSGPTVAARPTILEGTAAALRGPLPLATEPVEGDDECTGAPGTLGRGVVARTLAAAPFAAGEGGGCLLAVAHQRVSAPSQSSDPSQQIAATLDVLILPREPSPGWAALSAEDEAAAASTGWAFGDGPPVRLAPLATDDDEGSLPPLLAIDRVQLCAGEWTLRRPAGYGLALAAQNELAPFVSVAWDPGCRERVYCCAGGAVHGITLTWLSAVEGAADDTNDEDDPGGGSNPEGASAALSLPTAVTLLDSPEVLLGVAPVGDPLAEGLLIAVDAAGKAHALHPAPSLPDGLGSDGLGADGVATASHDASALAAAAAAAAAEASAELRALAEGPTGPPVAPPAGASSLKPGSVEGNQALAVAVASLKERHLRYAHRVHAAGRRHALRLGAEIRRQKAEAAAVRRGLQAVRERREHLAQRLEQTRAEHEAIRARLRKLAAAERSLPHPLTRAEAAFGTTLRASNDDIPLLRAKLEELKRRADDVAEVDVEEMGVVMGVGRVDGGGVKGTRRMDPAVEAELKAQEAAMEANNDRVKLIELAVGSSLDGAI